VCSSDLEGAGSPRLTAYVTAVAGQQPDPAALREYLGLRLPRYMLPATVTVLAAMPLTHNGKLARAALPDPARTRPAEDRVAAVASSPASPHEEAIAAVFRDVLGQPEIDVTANFFDLGGTSFDAVRAIRRIDGASVALLAAHPSVRALAAALNSAGDAPGILVRLTDARPAAHTLVCVPFGGGSAIAYQPLARSLSADVALYAAALPGHEPGGEPELRPLDDVAADIAQAVDALPDGPVSVYGHCAGVALAVEVTRRLEAAGRTVPRLFLGGSYPFYEPGPVGRTMQRAHAALAGYGLLPVSARTVGTVGPDAPGANQAVMRYLRSIGGFANAVDDETLAFVMRAFHHDVVTASRYFSARWSRRGGAETPPLAAPITFVAGTADPLTPRYEQRVRTWDRFSPAVELATVAGGQHYFVQHQAEIVARIIEGALAASTGISRPAYAVSGGT